MSAQVFDETSTWPLVRAAQSGDMAAFADLYSRHVSGVFRFAQSKTHDHSFAEDVTSETFTRALRSIGSLSYRGKDVAAWLFTITRNILADHHKSSRYRREITTDEPQDDDAGVSVEHDVLASFDRRDLWLCIEDLTEDQRQCVLLRFMAGLSVRETAALMHRGENAVKALQTRAVRRLAELFPRELRVNALRPQQVRQPRPAPLCPGLL